MNNSALRSDSSSLSPATSLSSTTTGFALAAAITALFNTGLAWAKDASPALNNFMKTVGGHHWTTHGLVDLVLFIGLGIIFTRTRAGEKIDPKRFNMVLVAAVAIAALGLGLWYVFF
jgi:cation transport ATPase